MKKKIGIGILIVLLAIQFIRIDKTNPEIDLSQTFEQIEKPNSDVIATLDVACMDCHSNETVYPWYSNIAPISWKLKSHVEGGRNHLNFSEWGSLSEEEKAHARLEIVEVVERKEMPMLFYWMVHWDAKLSDEQRSVLVEYFR